MYTLYVYQVAFIDCEGCVKKRMFKAKSDEMAKVLVNRLVLVNGYIKAGPLVKGERVQYV